MRTRSKSPPAALMTELQHRDKYVFSVELMSAWVGELL